MGRSERQRLKNRRPRTNYRAISPEERAKRRQNSIMDRKRYHAAMQEAKARICTDCREKSTRNCAKCQKVKIQAIFLCQYWDTITQKRTLL